MMSDLLRRGMPRGETGAQGQVDPQDYPPLASDLCDLVDILQSYGLLVDGFAFRGDTVNYIKQIEANGGRVKPAEMRAIDKFFDDCDTDQILTKIIRANFFIGDSLASASVAIVADPANPLDVLVNFIASDYTPANGLAITSNTRHVETGIDPSTDLNPVDHSLSVYSVGVIDSYLIGSSVNTPNRIGLRLVSSTSRRYYSGNATTSVAVAGTTVNGFYTGTRSGNDVRAYYNGVPDGTATATTASFAGCTDLQVPPSGLANAGGYLRGYIVATGLTATQAAALRTNVQAFMTAIGRAA